MKILSKAHVWLFFALVYAISAMLFLPILLSGYGMSTPVNSALIAAYATVPSVLGILFVRFTRSPLEQSDFWWRVFHWPKDKTRIALIGIFILPLNVIISFSLASLLNGNLSPLSYATRVLTDWKTLVVFLFVELTFGAISEELGWRGYALDELQSRWNALSSSLILGGIWAFWHTPAFLIPGTSQYVMGGIFSWTYVCFTASIIIGSIIHTWAYNNTGRNILVAGILMHFSQNAAIIFLGGIFGEFTLPQSYWTISLMLTTLTAGILTWMNGTKSLRCDLPFVWKLPLS